MALRTSALRHNSAERWAGGKVQVVYVAGIVEAHVALREALYLVF